MQVGVDSHIFARRDGPLSPKASSRVTCAGGMEGTANDLDTTRGMLPSSIASAGPDLLKARHLRSLRYCLLGIAYPVAPLSVPAPIGGIAMPAP